MEEVRLNESYMSKDDGAKPSKQRNQPDSGDWVNIEK